MSLRYRVIPSLLNGVSRQPPMLRASDQNEDELNTWASVSSGLSKRPPTEHVALLMSNLTPDAFVHYINRDTTERYCVVIDSGIVKVFDTATGQQRPVVAPHGFGYLAGGTYRAVTVADYTFIVNTSKLCAQVTSSTTADTVVQSPDLAWLNRTTGNAFVDAALVISGARNQYRPNVPPTGYMGELVSMEKLPETAANGTIYKINGSIDSNFVAYYVVRNGAVWDETVAPGQYNLFDEATMPHCLISEADGTFTFVPFSWAPRRAGDRETNPAPSFIGRAISDVFFYQNRLGFLVDENVIFSCAGDFGNFWRNTVLDYVDSDVIDAAAATTNVALLRFAIPFNEGIMAFADQTQFSISNGEEGLTPSSLSISPVTSYEINTKAPPVSIGSEVYFCGNQNGSSVVWEYTRLDQGDSLIAAEITAHVPGLLPANLKQLVSAPNERALFATTGTEYVYAYQFYWNGNEKIMSAWRPWRFQFPVVAAQYMDGHLYMVTKRPDGVYLERASLEEGAKPANQNDQVFLDARVTLTGTYDGVADRTTYSLPYAPKQSAFQLVRPKTHPTRPGSLMDPSGYQWITSNLVSVPGNEATATAGEAYQQRLTFSRQFPQDYQGRPMATGRLQLRTFTVSYSQTAFFRTEVAPYGTAMAPDIEEIVPAKLADFTGKVVGASALRLNRPLYHTGSFSFQVYGDAAAATVTLTNDTHCAATFVAAEWEGFHFHRASQ